MRAALISSDEAFDALVLNALATRGYETACSIDAPSASRGRVHADLVVVDFKTVGRQLMELVECIRGREPSIHVLALLPVSHATERTAVLNSGADDCLSRPFDPVELQARIRALERRSGRDIFHFGCLSWDWESRHGEIGSASIALSHGETIVLETLLRSPSQVIPLSRLTHALSNKSSFTTLNRLYVYICRLRKKLDSSGLRIRNVSGVGYSLGLASSKMTRATRLSQT